MRIVFDTNIYISALMFPGGRAEAALLKVIEGETELIVSVPVIHEVLDVLARKFDRDAEELARVAVYLAELGRVVKPKRKLAVLRDEPDNRIIECAVTGRANLIVTGNHAMLALGEHKGIRIVTLKAFLKEC
ncbi:MAG: putative toxin-antitoxin system toxin component, PIN family [Candidatus Muproteobacteria bacterium RBG_16_60_9]|uniref:Putative toxin-antitoxin system toxin component, PIN family n=1 Tax=Candidatus Muproteobacteria bacterium RBG_16_60_9 TaxID=1817755 RepID=A0A1F6V381_9PROT|nr:MAG: putative toxin-antitoxin system toxin component, PIN family [Candidatus Muproteobacteria bacterium RBG_16_60_9]